MKLRSGNRRGSFLWKPSLTNGSVEPRNQDFSRLRGRTMVPLPPEWMTKPTGGLGTQKQLEYHEQQRSRPSTPLKRYRSKGRRSSSGSRSRQDVDVKRFAPPREERLRRSRAEVQEKKISLWDRSCIWLLQYVLT